MDREVDWQAFGTQVYLEANYQQLLEADRRLCVELGRRYGALARGGSRRLRVLDVGTGPNLYPLIAALPVAASIEAGDLCDSNNEYLLAQRGNPSAHWAQFVEAMADGDELYRDLPWRDLLARAVRPRRIDVFDLPRDRWDLVSSFFVAESITDERGVFGTAGGRSFADAVSSLVHAAVDGGWVVVALMSGSHGYDTAGLELPATSVDEIDVRAALLAAGADCEILRVDSGVREGHDGMLLAFGRRRVDRRVEPASRSVYGLEVLHVDPRSVTGEVIDDELTALREIVSPVLLADATVLVLIDDYSLRGRPAKVAKLAQAAADAVVSRSAGAGVWVDAYVFESQLTGAADELVGMLDPASVDGGVLHVDASGKSGAREVRLWEERADGSRRYSCPMMAAAWQLCRLGLCAMPEMVRLSDAPVVAARSLTVLGGHYIHVESDVASILSAMSNRELAGAVRERLGWVLLPGDRTAPRREDEVVALVPTEGDLWLGFDVEEYTDRNYSEVLDVDAWLAERHRRWWDGHAGGDFVDVGAGSCLYPSMAAAAASSILAWEYSPPFCAYLEAQYLDADRRWDAYAGLVGAVDDWRTELAARGRVVRAGVMDLPESSFDRLSMHFVAECVDGTWAGFATAIASAVRALRPGGELLIAAMERSGDAEYGGTVVPVVWVDAADLAAALRSAGAVDVDIEVLTGDGATIREGHRGVMCARARRPVDA